MKTVEGEIIAKIGPSIDSEFVHSMQDAMRRDLENFSRNNQILAHEHISQLDTVSLTEKFTNTLGFCREIGLRKSRELTEEMHSLVMAEKRMMFDIATREYELAAVYYDLLRKVVAYANEAEAIISEMKARKKSSVNSLREKMEGYVIKRIESYKSIDPEESIETNKRFVEAKKRFRDQADKILADNSISDHERSLQYESALDSYFLRLNII